MTALEVAAHNMQQYGKLLDKRSGEAPIAETLVAAQTYALIAQAEQLKRIADYLENISGAYTAATFGYVPMAEGIINPEE